MSNPYRHVKMQVTLIRPILKTGPVKNELTRTRPVYHVY